MIWFCLYSLESLHNTEIKTIAFDFGNTSGYDKIENVLSGLNIGVLGNVAILIHITLKRYKFQLLETLPVNILL